MFLSEIVACEEWVIFELQVERDDQAMVTEAVVVEDGVDTDLEEDGAKAVVAEDGGKAKVHVAPKPSKARPTTKRPRSPEAAPLAARVKPVVPPMPKKAAGARPARLVPKAPAEPPSQSALKAAEESDELSQLDLPPAWIRVLAELGVDSHASEQLDLLRECNPEAASDIVWKLTKERSDEHQLGNPSAFVSRCVTSARKQRQSADRYW